MNTKKLNIFLILLFFLLFHYTNLTSQVLASIEWDKTEINCGKIKYKEPFKVEFKFKNTSMIPLIIEKVETSCGCTVTEYTKEPILQGKNSTIKVIYDADTPGYFQKTITVYTNTNDKKTLLLIKGEVIKN